MFQIIQKKWFYFILSALVIVPGTISLILWRMKPGIDFTGGTLVEYQSVSDANVLKKAIESHGIRVDSMQQAGEKLWIVRLPVITSTQHKDLTLSLSKEYPQLKESRYESVGPTIGKETTKNAAKAVLAASLMIIIYISWTFRQIPKPYTSWSFGFCAVLALLHDILLVVGVFSLLGHFYQVEVDSLFITALLTVMGFSVHDTIVVFDRIRENLKKMPGVPFDHVVNESIVQTMVRSVSTSLTVVFTLVALLLFGGESIRWFVVALLVGIVSGTYSSIFTASPLLVVWEQMRRKK